MSTGSNIITAVTITSMILAGWFLVSVYNLNHSLQTYEESRRNYELNKAANDIGEIMTITEPSLKMTIAELLGEIIYQRDGKIKYNNQELEVEKKIGELLDSIYGKENYYLEVAPPKTHIRLVFVIDGSMSLKDDLENIYRIVPKIEEHFKNQELTIENKMYILKENDEVSCDKIRQNIPQVQCIDDDLKEPNIKFDRLTQKNCPQKGKGLYNKYFVDTLKNPKSEYYLEEDMISVNQNDSYICSGKKTIENYQRILRGMYYEDWATGTAYAAKNIEQKQLNSSDPVLTLIFPVSDELSTGSESDATYSTKRTEGEQKYYNKRIYNSICNTDSTDQNRIKRAHKTIKHAINVLSETDYRVIPILTNPEYKITEESYKYCTNDGKYIGAINGDACCLSPPSAYCQECDSNKGVHTSQHLINQIKTHMQELADATKGKVIDISKGQYDERELETAMVEIISEITNKKFVFGTKKEKEERYSVSRAIPIRGNRALSFNFWVYKNKSPHKITKVPKFDLNPIVKAFASNYNEKVKDQITIKFWGNATSPVGKEVRVEWLLLKKTEENNTNAPTLISNSLSFERNFTKQEAGIYEITLKATDSSEKTSEDKITIILEEDKTTDTP